MSPQPSAIPHVVGGVAGLVAVGAMVAILWPWATTLGVPVVGGVYPAWVALWSIAWLALRSRVAALVCVLTATASMVLAALSVTGRLVASLPNFFNNDFAPPPDNEWALSFWLVVVVASLAQITAGVWAGWARGSAVHPTS